MVKKALLIAMTIATTAALVSPSSAARKPPVERTIDLTYTCPCGPRLGAMAWGTYLFGIGGASFQTEANERYLSVDINDASGGDVAAKIGVDSIPGNLQYEYSEQVCGATDSPVEIVPNAQVDIYLYWGTCSDMSTPSTPTTGVVSVTLSNAP